MMHSSPPNLTGRDRISIDTRYQLAFEPRDEPIFGENGGWLGNYYNKDAVRTPMEVMCDRWELG